MQSHNSYSSLKKQAQQGDLVPPKWMACGNRAGTLHLHQALVKLTDLSKLGSPTFFLLAQAVNWKHAQTDLNPPKSSSLTYILHDWSINSFTKYKTSDKTAIAFCIWLKRRGKKVTPVVLNVKSVLRISADSKYMVADTPSCGESPAEATFLTEQSLEQVDAVTWQDQGPSRYGKKKSWVSEIHNRVTFKVGRLWEAAAQSGLKGYLGI